MSRIRAWRTGPVVGGGRGAAGPSPYAGVNRSPAGYEHLRRAHFRRLRRSRPRRHPSGIGLLLLGRAPSHEVRTILGPLAAGEALLDVVEAGDEVGDGVDDVVRPALAHPQVGALPPRLPIRGRERLHLLEG